MTIVTSRYRYKPPPRKRKPAAPLEGPRIVTFRLPPERHWRSYGTEPLPTPEEAMDQPLASQPMAEHLGYRVAGSLRLSSCGWPLERGRMRPAVSMI
jgi:hypothetical protein